MLEGAKKNLEGGRITPEGHDIRFDSANGSEQTRGGQKEKKGKHLMIKNRGRAPN